MLIVRGTKKLRDRLKGAPLAHDGESMTALGDWFANALFWRPQAVLLVNERTLLPVFVPLAPAATLLERVPAAIEAVLRWHGASEEFLASEREAMRDVRVAPTNNRRVLGVMNEYAYHGDVGLTEPLAEVIPFPGQAAATRAWRRRCTTSPFQLIADLVLDA